MSVQIEDSRAIDCSLSIGAGRARLLAVGLNA
jgi:hypothetical protein